MARKRRLTNLRIAEVSVVDKAANKTRFFFVKNDDGDEIEIDGPEMIALLEEIDTGDLTYDELVEGVMEAIQASGMVEIG